MTRVAQRRATRPGVAREVRMPDRALLPGRARRLRSWALLPGGAPRLPGWVRLPGWALRPVVPVLALLLAATVSLVHGQPSPVEPPVGVSIPADDAAPTPTVGQLMLVYGGALYRVNPVSRGVLAVPMPAGARVLLVLPCYRTHVALVRLRSGRLVAYAVPDSGGLVRLGEASALVPDIGNRSVWLATSGRVRRYRLDGTPLGAPVWLPTGYHPVSGIRGEVIAASSGLHDARTVLLPDQSHRRRVLADGEALDVAGSMVLLRRDDRLAVLDMRTGVLRRLPVLAAVHITGPGTLMEDAAAFAVVGTVGDHQRLVIGPIAPQSGSELQVVGLDGGRPLPFPPPARWTDYGSVLAVRPDGKVVFYRPGQRSAAVLDLRLPPVTAVAAG
jgi:hypothetical protein